MVLYILAKKPNTRTMIAFLFVNLSVADLLLTVFVVPVSVAFYFRNAKWVEGPQETYSAGFIVTVSRLPSPPLYSL